MSHDNAVPARATDASVMLPFDGARKALAEFHDLGIYLTHPQNPRFTLTGDGPFANPWTPDESFREACKVVGLTEAQAMEPRRLLAKSSDAPMIGDALNAIDSYRVLRWLRSRVADGKLTIEQAFSEIEQHAFSMGRATERAFVRASEPAARVGKSQRACAAKLSQQNRVTTPAALQKLQLEVNHLCKIDGMGFQKALHKIASKRGNPGFSTLKNLIKNPNSKK